MPYPGLDDARRSRRPRRREPTRRAYRLAVADALAHGETDILTFAQFKKVFRLQQRLAATDPGGNIVL